MNDLAYWLSVLIWPAGVGVLVLAVHLQARRDERRWQAAKAEAKGSAHTLDDLDRRVRTLEAAVAHHADARKEAAE